MRHTIFDTPVVRQLFLLISWIGLKLTGWKLEGKLPAKRRFVMIAAPHTSNWDFPLMIAMAFCFRIKVFWMGKDTLFRGPMGPIMKWLGGIPVNRSAPGGLVQQVVDCYHTTRELVVVIPPEGTRSAVQKWKSGFYRIADGAGVPIALGFLDFKRKVGGFGPMFKPTGDYDADLINIQAFYASITPKHHAKY
ncbi:lysophospholipid acyltransferase family protein [Endozoicomonadaceae bacterium StTr2]